MYPKIYDKFGRLLAILDNIIQDTAQIKRVVNGEFTFTFEALESELKSEYFDTENRIVIGEQSFDIRYIEQTHDIEVKYAIQCEHVNYRMTDGDNNIYSTYSLIGTPTQILTDLLHGTEFSVGKIDYDGIIDITSNTEITRKSLIYQLANSLGGEIEYSNSGFTINILDTIGRNNGFQVRFGKNLKGIKKTIDKRGGLKTSYNVDIIELKNSNEYIDNQLQDLEVIGIGDTVRIIDEVMGIDIENRILSIEYNPIFAINTKLEIANTIDLISDTIQTINNTTVHQGTTYNGVRVSPEEGFVSERADGKVKASMNAAEGLYIRTDNGSGLTPVFYVDTNGRIKAKQLDIDGSGTFAGEVDVTNGRTNVKIAPTGNNSFIIFYDGSPILSVGSDGTVATNNGVFKGVLEATTMRSEWVSGGDKRIMHITDNHFEVEYLESDVTKYVSNLNSEGLDTKDYTTGGNGIYGPNGISIGPTEGSLFLVNKDDIRYKNSTLINEANLSEYAAPINHRQPSTTIEPVTNYDQTINLYYNTPVATPGYCQNNFAAASHLQSSYSITPVTNSDQTIGLYYNTPVATPSYCWSNFAAKTASDFRLKKDIKSLDIPTELFMGIKVKQFSFKTNAYGKGIHFGVLSQEVESLFLSYGLNPIDYNLFELDDIRPYTDDGMYVTDKIHRINYDNFIAPMISMIQRQQNTIDGLEQRVIKLEANTEPVIVPINKEVNNE